MANNSPLRAVTRLEIREASSSDLEKIYEIEKLCFGSYAYDRQLLQMYLYLSPDTFLVVEDTGIIVGYIIGLLKKWGEAHIISLAVHPSYRRRGAATVLMKTLLEKFRIKGAKSVRLEVRISNIPAIKLYEKLGFKVAGYIKNYYPDGEDAYLMVIQL
ncbi:MAG: ribosomal protein S18-alanine N-acetyltransferase [Thermofilaceae archaeon]|nr:ribosomal protein S18-alanine N-acetyltransferase [Thermofilaceae archaeon]MCX8181173.1 ribosomal protein S18-alanine N-acetyltransferase [Thermofilaceae archaeon]MDW8004796.1 ribosomal protein S18-alanine N-acetyltransferase [Thermofilaceae archaeon]